MFFHSKFKFIEKKIVAIENHESASSSVCTLLVNLFLMPEEANNKRTVERLF